MPVSVGLADKHRASDCLVTWVALEPCFALKGPASGVLQEAVLNLRWFVTGYRVAGGQGSTPLSCGLTCALLLPFDIESLVAAIGHHGPETVVRSTWVAICDAWRLSAPHWDALDGQGRRAPLSASQAFNLR